MARSEGLVSGSIRGVSVEQIVSLDTNVRFEAMSRFIETCGGTPSIAEKNWRNSGWRPLPEVGFSVDDEAGWNWDWKPIQVNQNEIDRLMQLANAFNPQPDLRGLSVEEKKFIVYGMRKDTSNWTRVSYELNCRILARIPSRDVLRFLLVRFASIPASWSDFNSIQHEYSYAREIFSEMRDYKLLVYDQYHFPAAPNGVLYAIVLSRAYSISDLLDAIAAEYDVMVKMWSGVNKVNPETTVQQIMAYILVSKAMAEAIASRESDRSPVIQTLLSTAIYNSNLHFAQQAESVRKMAVEFAKRKSFE